MTSSAIVGLNAFLNSSNLPMNGLGGLLWKFFWQIGLLTPCSEVPWENTHSIQSRLLHHLWGHCAFLIYKTMDIYANTLNMNNFTHFKMNLKIIKCYKSFIMLSFVMPSYPTHFQAMCVFEIYL